jgi:hypothetical protein
MAMIDFENLKGHFTGISPAAACVSCTHSRMSHYHYEPFSGTSGCTVRGCNCDDFEPPTKAEEIKMETWRKCSCGHRRDLHSDATHQCIMRTCHCKNFVLLTDENKPKPIELQKTPKDGKTAPAFAWERDGAIHSLKIQCLNLAFNAIQYQDHWAVRCKGSEQGFYSDIAKCEDWTGIDNVVYNVIVNRIKEVAKSIQLLETDDIPPKFDWEQASSTVTGTLKCKVGGFGADFYLYPAPGGMELWRDEGYCRKQVAPNGIIPNILLANKKLFEHVKGCVGTAIVLIKD